MKDKAPLKDSMVLTRNLSPYDEMLLEMVQGLGGFNNAHTHIDRADTLDDKYLRERMSRVITRLISYGTTRLATCIDATSDIAENGLLAFKIAAEFREKFAGQIKIEIGPNPIFGFKKGSGRWEIFVEAAKTADFLSGLPEKDEFVDLTSQDGRVGFCKHLRMVMELGCELKKEVHLHLDQANDPNEIGTETLLEGLKWIDQPQISNHNGPTLCVIHMISPSGY